MSFLSTAFSGASNNFTPQGSPQLQQQIQTANQNYATANSGFDSLAKALQDQMAGRGPNLANQQLQNATGQNVANQAALMAGQRGASSNVGLMSRQIANQGANIQQQAAGQSASNVLAQQLAAQQQLGGVYQAQAGAANQNYATSQGGQNQNNQIGSNAASFNAKMNQDLIGGIAGGGAKMFGMSEGGQIPEGSVAKQSGFGQNFLQGLSPAINAMMLAKGGAVLPFSPSDYRQGGEVQAKAPQQQATVQGNSLKNDKIPAMVSEGEVVIPRSVMQSKDPAAAAAQFVAQVMAGKHKGRK